MKLAVLALVVCQLALASAQCLSVSCNTPYSTHAPLPNRPPDKIDLGRSTWLYLHTSVAYMPIGPLSNDTVNHFENLLATVLNTYPCELCRQHFTELINSGNVFDEFKAMVDNVDAVLWLWKVHNSVTSRQSPGAPLFAVDALEKNNLLTSSLKADFSTLDLSSLSADVKNAIYDKVQTRWGKLEHIQSAKPEVNLWVMAACPFGHIAESRFQSVYNLLKDKITFQMHFILMEPSASWPAGTSDHICIDGGKYCSMHGSEEVPEDARQIAMFSKLGADDWWKYVTSFNNENCAVPDYQACSDKAAKMAGVSNKVSAHAQTKILEDALTSTLDNNIDSSPTMVVNGQRYEGLVSTNDFLAQVCAHFTVKPAECSHDFGPDGEPVNAGHCGVAVAPYPYPYKASELAVAAPQSEAAPAAVSESLMLTVMTLGLVVMALGVAFVGGLKVAEMRHRVRDITCEIPSTDRTRRPEGSYNEMEPINFSADRRQSYGASTL